MAGAEAAVVEEGGDGEEALVVGVGAVLTAALTSLTIDVTGAIGGTILVLAGLFLLPHRRGRLKRELSTKVELLNAELSEAIEQSFREEVRRYAARLREIFEPERDATNIIVDDMPPSVDRIEGANPGRGIVGLVEGTAAGGRFVDTYAMPGGRKFFDDQRSDVRLSDFRVSAGNEQSMGWFL